MISEELILYFYELLISPHGNNSFSVFIFFIRNMPWLQLNYFCKPVCVCFVEYLAVFGHLIAFHEPELSTHLDTIGFIPDVRKIVDVKKTLQK